jgi:membrane peptidoglycan carboxypeptidase
MQASTAARKALAVVKLTLAVAVAGLLVAGMLLPFAGGVGVAARNSVQAFDDQPCDVSPTTPAQASVIYTTNGKPIARFYSQNREIVPLAKIAPVARKAVVAIEDRRFYEHHGVDLQATIRALIENSRSGGVVQGGSTLTQQYIKQVRLYSATSVAQQKAAVAQTTARKLIEAKCALTLEQKLRKDQILERYLNIAYFGSGAYGIQTAAKTYFGKSAAALTLPESAMLAGLVQSPSRYDPHLDKKAATARRNTVLDEMQSLGYVTAKQNAQAKTVPVAVKPRRSTSKDCANANKAIPNAGFFCDYVKHYLSTIGYPQRRLESGGFKIYTTLDPIIQRRSQAAVFGDMPANLHATSVMDVLDTKTGKVRAMAVSKHYGINKRDRRQTSNGLGYKAVAGAGSTYKLFVLVAALQRKIPLEAFTIDNTNSYKPTNCASARGKKEVHNANPYPVKPYNLDEATYASVNTFFVALLDQQLACDLSMPVRDALNMGLLSLRPYADDIINGQQFSFTLGPQKTSPLELASAYATVANDGRYCPPTPLERIVGPDGKTLGLPERPCSQQIDPAIAHTISQVLVKDTKPGFAGTANHRFTDYYAAGGSDIAGKTGTASAGETGLNSSAWFIGYTPNITASVATFDPDASSAPLQDVPGYENASGEVFGSFSAHIWNDALSSLLLGGPRWQFPPADPNVVNGNSVPVPSVVGQDVGTATQILANAGFGITVSNERRDAPLPPDRIAAQSPSGRGLPGQKITVYLSSGQAPKPREEQTPGPPRRHGGGGGPGG